MGLRERESGLPQLLVRLQSQCGQGSIEWVGIVAAVAVLMVGVLDGAKALGLIKGPVLAATLVEKIKCSIDHGQACKQDKELQSAYSEEEGYTSDIADLVRQHAPEILYEKNTKAMPVDFRKCRKTSCGDGNPAAGLISKTDQGRQATVFTHVVDRRRKGGSLYIHYNMYYADSFTGGGRLPGGRSAMRVAGRAVGRISSSMGHKLGGDPYHRDDWESYQVKITPSGRVYARSSAHNGYRGQKRVDSQKKTSVLRKATSLPGKAARIPGKVIDSSAWDGTLRCGDCKSNWTPENGIHRVSGGSHGGHIPTIYTYERHTPAVSTRLIPTETLKDSDSGRFKISPPWDKNSYEHPESRNTKRARSN